MGVRYKRRTKKGKSIPRVIEFVVNNRKEIRDAVRDVADITKNVKKCNRSYKKENRARYPSYNRIISPYINGRHVEGSFAGRERGVSGHNRESAN